MWQTIKSIYQSAAEDVAYDAYVSHESGDTVPSYLQQQYATVALFLSRAVAAVICWKKGHEITCDGFAGPDSGYEDFSCSRCGWSHHVIYY